MVTFIAPAFHEPIECRPLIDSLLRQTNSAWDLLVYHNGPNQEMKDWVASFNDERILYLESDSNTGAWGCYNRQDALQYVTNAYVVQTSIQDVYEPNLVELIVDMVVPTDDYPDVIIWDSYNHLTGSEPLICELSLGRIDWGNAAVSYMKALDIGIRHPEEFIADWLFFKDLIDGFWDLKVKKINKILTTHK